MHIYIFISENKGRLGEFIMDFFIFFKGHNEDNFFFRDKTKKIVFVVSLKIYIYIYIYYILCINISIFTFYY